ncbi:hypothetical protein [Adhaeribacter pallidiroseus]|uniref:Uncharacterized protein n=1 Tax=Adhaeribacter pallidiroseus TaxID=2072847 RepID=A0A369QL65_9BACT|nr:hypothetical protein [Adhaeribacter pallidiroseus]RDC65641.1 hypothetical protein AHMF7616_04271 [Adhaeribacter pallidiroseus]
MKKALILLAIFTGIGLISAYVVFNPVFSKKMKTVPTIAVSRDRLYNDVQYLTRIEPARQAFNQAGIELAATYIYQEFKK